LPWQAPEDEEPIVHPDPFDERKPLPTGLMQRPEVQQCESATAVVRPVIKTALCVEVRNGVVNVFLPPLSTLDANISPLYTGMNSLNTYGNYYVDTGAVNAYVITCTAQQALSLAAGLPIQFICFTIAIRYLFVDFYWFCLFAWGFCWPFFRPI
jgi:hypothetical protein